MSKKLPERFNKVLYKEPKKPKSGSKKFRIEMIEAVSDRYHYFPNSERDGFYEDDNKKDNPEYSGKLPARQSISLQQINNLIEEYGLNPKAVYLTASFADDYLCVEVVHIKSLNDEEQLEEYEEQHAEWTKQQEQKKEEELKRIEWEMEALKRRATNLKKNV